MGGAMVGKQTQPWGISRIHTAVVRPHVASPNGHLPRTLLAAPLAQIENFRP